MEKNAFKSLQATRQSFTEEEPKAYYSLVEAAKYLCMSKSTLYKHTSAGNISYYKPNGKLILFSKDELDLWIKKTKIPSNEEITNRH